MENVSKKIRNEQTIIFIEFVDRTNSLKIGWTFLQLANTKMEVSGMKFRLQMFDYNRSINRKLTIFEEYRQTKRT